MPRGDSQVFLAGEHLALVMEYMPARLDLGAVTRAQAGLPEGEARWIFQQITFAMEYSHRAVSPILSLARPFLLLRSRYGARSHVMVSQRHHQDRRGGGSS